MQPLITPIATGRDSNGAAAAAVAQSVTVCASKALAETRVN